MAYSPPPGSAIVARFSAGDYTPPLPDAVVAQFVASVPVIRRLSAGVMAPWRRPAPVGKALLATQPAARTMAIGRCGAWLASSGIGRSTHSHWQQARLLDPSPARGMWGRFAAPALASFSPAWIGAEPRDRQSAGAWGQFGDLAIANNEARWNGSIPADHARAAPWSGPRMAMWQQQPWPLPDITLIEITVEGGGIRCQLDAADYSPPAGNIITGQFPSAGYIAPLPLIPGTLDARIPWRHADITVGAEVVPRLDALGNPVVDTSALNTHRLLPWGRAVPRSRDRVHPWTRYSRPLNPGWGIVTPPGPSQPDPGEQIIIPIRSAYIVVNEIQLFRADDTTPIDARNLRITFDADSWLPTCSATIPWQQRDAVMPSPDPVEILAYVNGAEFRFMIHRIDTARQFGQRVANISGISLAAELASPYADITQHSNASAMTAQQLIDAALEYTGYTQDWQITDWSVPAGILNLAGAPADVALHVAEAAGAVLQADWSLKRLRMLPRYPVKPWDWAAATPDIIIPAAVTQSESIEYLDLPEYNLVYVAGQTAGITGQVKITGTAGDKPAPMITHPLITHADAARQRGIATLGYTGRRAIMQISLPVLEESGVIDVCRLVEFTDGANTRRGITRRTEITVDQPTVRQTITIEAAP